MDEGRAGEMRNSPESSVPGKDVPDEAEGDCSSRLDMPDGENEWSTTVVAVNLNGTKEVYPASGEESPGFNKLRKASTETSVFSYSIVPSELVLSDCVNSTQDLSKYKPKRKRTIRNALPEIFASCSATSFHVMVGVTFAATASLLPQLEDEESDIKATKNEIAWIASVFVLVIPVASIFSGFVMETFGRLNAVKLSIVPSVASCILIALSTDVYMLIGGRFLMGIGAALGTNPAVVYITEITSPEYRGALVSSGPTLASLGMMLGYLSGAFLPWRTVSWINIVYCLIPLVLIVVLFVPESPTWLVSKERIEQARQNLLWLARCEDQSVRDKIVERKLKELMKDREEKLSKMKGQSFWRRLNGLRRPSGYKPLFIMIILFAFQQYTGVYITTFYAVQFFESAGSLMNPFHASILIGLTRLVMSVVTVFLLKLFGRRPLCMTSCVGMAIFMAISGFYTRRATETGSSRIYSVWGLAGVQVAMQLYRFNKAGRAGKSSLSVWGSETSPKKCMSRVIDQPRQNNKNLFLVFHENSMVPVYSILLYVCFCMIGLLSLPWTMSAEVFPTEIRGLAHGLVIASAHIFMFITIKTYYEMTEFFGGHDVLQWFFSSVAILALVFVYFFLPETHRKSLFEIEEYFKNHTVYVMNKKKKRAGRERQMSVKILDPVPEDEGMLKQGARETVLKSGDKHLGDINSSNIDFIDKSALELNKMPDS